MTATLSPFRWRVPRPLGAIHAEYSDRLLAFLPALVLALLTFWSGTLFGGATFSGAASAHLALLGLSALAAPAWHDPLALGWRGRLLPLALLVAVGLSWWLSPVERAGRAGLVLLPALLLAPAAVARCWRNRQVRALGLAAVSLVTGATALASLLWWWRQGSTRAAMPLGHHNLLAVSLVLLWPIAVLPLRQSRAAQRLARVVAGLAAAALVASGSLLAAIALATQGLLVARWWPRTRVWVAALCLLALATQIPRGARLIRNSDLSLQARATYLAAGWRGSLSRPALGWGPGSVPWTATRFLRPRAGVNPPSEIVGDLHSLPVQLAYEIGLPGLLLALATIGLFARRRLVESPAAQDPQLLRASLVSLAGGAVFTLGNSALAILALPFAAALAAGAALSASAMQGASNHRPGRAVVAVYLGAAVLTLLPLDRAHFHYQRALGQGLDPATLERLARASALDPDFPLYRARSAWLAARLGHGAASAATEARKAAHDAVGVAPLWLAAGILAADAGKPWAQSALETAARLDPLSPLAAFHRMRLQPGHPEAPRWGAQALEAEPRLAAAHFWADHRDLRRLVLERLAPGAGASARRILESVGAIGNSATPSGEGLSLALTLDTEAAVSFSLYAFRRSPWPAALAPVALDARLLAHRP